MSILTVALRQCLSPFRPVPTLLICPLRQSLTRVTVSHRQRRHYSQHDQPSSPPDSAFEPPRQEDRIARKYVRRFMWVPVAIFFLNHYYTIAKVEGGSMTPTMKTDDDFHDLVLLNRFAAASQNTLLDNLLLQTNITVRKQNLQVGDVVYCTAPFDPNLNIVKRILAMPGDIVQISTSGSSFTTSTTTTIKEETRGDEKVKRIRIPPGHVWVEGDASSIEYQRKNYRGNNQVEIPSNYKSRDSRMYGPIPLGLITARVDFILLPFSRFGPPAPRPGFDLEAALARRKAKEQNESVWSRLHSSKAHPDDSSITPYTDWEWSKSEGDLNKAATRSSARKNRRDESVETEWRERLSRISRGGQLGRDADGTLKSETSRV